MDPDLLLIQKMRMGDDQAIETFVRKYYPRILRYCQQRSGDRGYGEDLTQETFARFFGSLKKYRDYGKAANYLYAIARNACNDYHRIAKEYPAEEFAERPDARWEGQEERLDVRLTLEALPEELQEVAILYFVQEQKQKDIARILGISLPLVKYRIRRIRELFTARYGPNNLY